VAQPVASKCGFLYVYVSNETSNIPVYFDNLQVSHIRSPLLETSEYYPYGLKMANISYKASMTMTNRYGWNGGNEYEDEGELNYSNTFYRKYDAQIGRFTGIDMLAEKFAGINPYQFGNNNPVVFNDPMGDEARNGRMQKGKDGDYHPDWYNETLWGDDELLNRGGSGGGDFGAYWSYVLSAAFETAGNTSIQAAIPIPGFGNAYFGLDLANNQWGFFALGTTTNPYTGTNATILALTQTLTDLANSSNSVVSTRFFAMLNDASMVHNIYSSTTSIPAVITNAAGAIIGTNTNFQLGNVAEPLDNINLRNGTSNNRATFAADFLSTTYNNSRGRGIELSSQTFNGSFDANGNVIWAYGTRDSQKVRIENDSRTSYVSRNAMDRAYIENVYRRQTGDMQRTFFRDQYWDRSGLSLNRIGTFNTTRTIEHYGIFVFNGWFHF
jgi:RHS repeat-associated protein